MKITIEAAVRSFFAANQLLNTLTFTLMKGNDFGRIGNKPVRHFGNMDQPFSLIPISTNAPKGDIGYDAG